MAANTTVKTDEEKKQDEQLEQAASTVQSIMGSNPYTPGSSVTQAQEQLKAYQDKKPAEYVSRWKDQMDTMLNNILNRKDFQYDVNADPLFQQYRDQYIRNGQMAMRDTMGQAAQMTGGYGNSYAQQAGQQAYNGYMQGLTDKIPALYDLAMQAYNNKTNDMMNRYNLMGAQEGTEYGRYQDGLNAYNTELDRLQKQYDTERSYDYGQYRDTVADKQQQWANAWAMFQAGHDTPEIREILGLPESTGGGGQRYSESWARLLRNRSAKKNLTYDDVKKAAGVAFANGDSKSAYGLIISAQKDGRINSSQGYEISKQANPKYNQYKK